MNKKKPNELTVEEAAGILGVTPRSVINYVRAKEFEAIKVGKTWFINRPSFDVFKQRYGFKASPTEISVSVPENLEQTVAISGNFSKNVGRGPKRKVYPVHSLRLFQLAKAILKELEINKISGPNPGPKEKLYTMKLEALEFLGAGFYAYEPKLKKELYNRSREKVGGMLSIIYFYHESGKLPVGVDQIEEELLPAFSALIRRIEKKHERT